MRRNGEYKGDTQSTSMRWSICSTGFIDFESGNL